MLLLLPASGLSTTYTISCQGLPNLATSENIKRGNHPALLSWHSGLQSLRVQPNRCFCNTHSNSASQAQGHAFRGQESNRQHGNCWGTQPKPSCPSVRCPPYSCHVCAPLPIPRCWYPVLCSPDCKMHCQDFIMINPPFRMNIAKLRVWPNSQTLNNVDAF